MAERRGGAPTARNRRARPRQGGLLPVLAQEVRKVELASQRGQVGDTTMAKFQAIAILLREERQNKPETKAAATEHARRLDGIATILASAAAVQPKLFSLLDDGAEVTAEVRAERRLMEQAAGRAAQEPEPEAVSEAPARPAVVPRAIISRQLANPFQVPEFSTPTGPAPSSRRLESWELIEPLLSSFERANPGSPACMALPEPDELSVGGRELMLHQAKFIAAAAAGHRTFLLADEPGLGKTAQALLAAQAANAYPLLVVVPNVVKINWAREAEIWTPRHRATVVHGDADDLDASADIVIVNYEVLDRHVGWMGEFGFRGMVVDEAHFIKNKSSQRTQNVLKLADKARTRVARPLMIALTGTPLVNDIEDFTAIWEFLGWIDAKKPRRELMDKLELTGLTPQDRGFLSVARQSVIDMGIVRRRKHDVAADIPERRIADLPVELSAADGRDIRKAEDELALRLLQRYDAAIAARTSGAPDGIDHDLVLRVAKWERDEAKDAMSGNMFALVRRIGQAKAPLAADYAAQLSHNVGKVVFFAKHIDVMDAAQAIFAERGIKYVSIRGDQTAKTRQAAVDGFVNDPEVKIAVCSLMAAGVGLNLQVASNVVLAELSWTDAEQQQAIDRVHRIGQGEPVTAWRVLAAQTIDARLVELVDSKAGLAARALDGADAEDAEAVDVQLQAMAGLLADRLEARG